MTHPLRTLHVLQKARALPTDNGHWMKGDYFQGHFDTDQVVPDNACMCMLGAVAKAAGVAPGHMHRHPGAEDTCRVITKPLWSLGLSAIIADFNDAEETTHADVLRVLAEAVAAQLREAKADVEGLTLVDAAELSSLSMLAGNEKKYSSVVKDQQVLTWVGMGWIPARPASDEDYGSLPVVV